MARSEPCRDRPDARVRRLTALLTLLALAACTSPSAPLETLRVTLQATPASVVAGEPVTLHWSIVGSATSLSITPGVGDVTDRSVTTVMPTSTTTYVLIARGPAGTTTASATVVVHAPPPPQPAAPTIIGFTASPSTVQAGDTATLAWTVSGDVTSLSISPEVGDVTGLSTVTVAPINSLTYTLTATGPGGTTTASAAVVVQNPTPPIIETFTATPALVQPGNAVTLAWSVSGTINNLTVNPDVGDVTGLSSVVVNPTSTTTYRLVASGPAGSIGEDAEVVVSRPPVSVLAAAPTSGVLPLEVTFSASESYDPDGLPLVYNWDFGDGTGASAVGSVHTYMTAGTYAASLTVADQSGLTDTATTVIQVQGRLSFLFGPSGCPQGTGGYAMLRYSVGSQSYAVQAPPGGLTLTHTVSAGTRYSATATVYGLCTSVGLAISHDDVRVFAGNAVSVSYSGTY